MLYIPERFGHGYQTLTDSAEVFYLTSALYTPASARGVLYNDPAFGIEWPLPVGEISEADRKWPSYEYNEKLRKAYARLSDQQELLRDELTAEDKEK